MSTTLNAPPITAALSLSLLAGYTTVGSVTNPRDFTPVQRPEKLWLTHRDSSRLAGAGVVLLDLTVISVGYAGNAESCEVGDGDSPGTCS